MLSPGIHRDVSRADYDADPGLNQSLVKKFAEARTPAHFKYDQEHAEQPDTDSIRIGNAVDWTIFEPTSLPRRLIVWPGERRGKDWAAFKEEHKAKVILSQAESLRAIGAVDALLHNTDSSRWISSSEHQVMIIAEHPDFKIRMKGLLDMLPPKAYGWVGDLKTTMDASAEGFALQSFKMGYHVQAAYYLDLLKFAGEPAEYFGFICVENEPYHGVAIHGIHHLSAEAQLGRQTYESAIVALSRHRTENVWPAYPNDWSKITYKPWQLKPQEEFKAIV